MEVMALADLERHLQPFCDRFLKIKLNDNLSTMLSIKWEPACIKLSLHRIFLAAPLEVMNALAVSIASKRASISPKIKAFIQDKIQTVNCSSQVVEQVEGSAYNLRHLYNDLNAEYFDNQLDLKISWFVSKKQNTAHMNLGLFHEAKRLIKVNHLMDSLFFPEYFVKFVIYHEMLHAACPPYVDNKGINRIHHEHFKQREQAFKEYGKAKRWLKVNLHKIFEPTEELLIS